MIQHPPEPPGQTLAAKAVSALRILSADMVEAAGSGHPGTPLGAAPMTYVLWTKFIQHNPRNPAWPNRDRFILSPGHASALIYALLYLTGYNLPLGELKRFRGRGSRTPGHPEVGYTPGVEMTTGPLGQGFAHGVDVALAERALAARYNRPGHAVIDHHTYAIVSDGDMQEGVSSEAASLAGTLKLGRLVYLYDDNDIQIEGPTDVSFREDVAARFRAYGWGVVGPLDGNDVGAVERAVCDARGHGAPFTGPLQNCHRLRQRRAGNRQGPRRAARGGEHPGDERLPRLAARALLRPG